ncbi:hypothetical protein BDV98DRAFT_594843 [Pterulicium gracile]|uniref:Uncharacterized protein n=1 Tax=Pterulicium gracile TaxID=1884261 RepID=A0A5C3QEK6_9AGAR|nr:hypothetical protein BDV98DRAFT_594843 [Pterula gracilis]
MFNVNRFHGLGALFHGVPEFLQASSWNMQIFDCEQAILTQDEIIALLVSVHKGAQTPSMLRHVFLSTIEITPRFLDQVQFYCPQAIATIRWFRLSITMYGLFCLRRSRMEDGEQNHWQRIKFMTPIPTSCPIPAMPIRYRPWANECTLDISTLDSAQVLWLYWSQLWGKIVEPDIFQHSFTLSPPPVPKPTEAEPKQAGMATALFWTFDPNGSESKSPSSTWRILT